MLEIINLSYKKIIENISLKFLPGKVHGIIGPNGSGKTTLLKAICGIWIPTAGKVIWDQNNLHSLKREQISKILTFVPQNPQVYFNFTVAEFVMMGRYTYQKNDVSVVEWALKKGDVWHLKDRSINEISVGERQMAYITRALVTQSPIILFDEPTANLDIRHQISIWQLIKELKNMEKIIIISNHDLSTTRQYCDDVGVIHQGKCVVSGKFHEKIDDKILYKVFGVTKAEINLNIANEAKTS